MATNNIMFSQTKILEGGTKDEMRISNEALFNGQLLTLSSFEIRITHLFILPMASQSSVHPSKIFGLGLNGEHKDPSFWGE